MERREPGRATAWLLPDLALALALFTLFYALAFYRAPEQLFRDSDTVGTYARGNACCGSGLSRGWIRIRFRGPAANGLRGNGRRMRRWARRTGAVDWRAWCCFT